MSIAQTIIKKKLLSLVRAAISETLEEEGFSPRKKNGAKPLAELADDLLESLTPKKGVHYDDGEDGEPGKDGEDGADGEDGIDGVDGMDADEEAITDRVIESVMKKIRIPLDGKDGKSAEPLKLEELVEEVVKRSNGMIEDILKGRKLKLGDIEGLEVALANARGAKKGGQGKTNVLLWAQTNPVGTDVKTTDNTTFTFTNPPLESELEIHRGGARQFKENGDYTVAAFPGGRVKSITLASQLQVGAGETLNFRTKG